MRIAAGSRGAARSRGRDVYCHEATKEVDSWSEGVPPGALEEIAAVIGSHWTLGYENLGPATTTAGLMVISISVVEVFASTLTRVIIIYRRKGLSLWVLSAAWGTAFQVVSLPIFWASECGQQQAMTVAPCMEARVGEVELPAAGGGPALLN
jgi:hypothetical protein